MHGEVGGVCRLCIGKWAGSAGYAWGSGRGLQAMHREVGGVCRLCMGKWAGSLGYRSQDTFFSGE